MKLKYQFVFKEVYGTYMGLTAGKDARAFSGVLNFNETGYDICRRMTEEISREELIDQLLEEYDSDRETIGRYVDEVVDTLQKEGLVI